MRKIRKPWPPANVSHNGKPVRTFVHAEQNYLAALPAAQDKTAFARTEFDQLDKVKLREVMYREQRHICAFCERPISEGKNTPRIDHWKPLSRNPELALHWKNLYLSCNKTETCDCAKGNQSLKWNDADPGLPWPHDFAYEKVIGFTRLGEMYVRDDVVLDQATRNALKLAIADCHDGSRKRSAILNLNHPTLVAARAAVIDSERTKLQIVFKGKTASREERIQRADALSQKNPLPRFVSIRVAWLKKMLGKGQ